MARTGRRLTSPGVGVLSSFLVRKTSRQERREALREAILADYARAGADPEFMAEMAEVESDFAGTLQDLDDPANA